jgi:hypothetical protein
MLYQEPTGGGPDKQPEQPPAPQKPRPDADAFAAKLRQSVRRRRPWTPLGVALTLLVVGAPLALAAWWFWPQARVPELIVVAFDEVGVADRPVELRAATEPQDGSDVRWGERDLLFEELPHAGAGASPRVLLLHTDARGLGGVVWAFPVAAAPAEVRISYVDKQARPPWSDTSHGRVFSWPTASKLLVVDVDPTLKDAKDLAAAATALAVANRAGWKIVYLAVGGDRPLAYRKLREWALEAIGRQTAPLPDGPVLARTKFFEGVPDVAARKEVLAALRRDFRGPVAYVFVDGSLKVQTIGPDGTLPDPPQAAGEWAKLAGALPQ